MKRRAFLMSLAVSAAALASACATAPAASPSAGFTSDRISVVTRGEGRDVIFIPGMSSHRDVWATTVEALGAGTRVHLVQVNGFAGFPTAGNGDGPVSAPVAEEIARYIDEAGLDRPAVIGHSMGGTIGMMLAARHPDAVGKLMVVDMFLWMGAMFGGPGATVESVRPVADQIRGQMRMAGGNPMMEQMIAGMVRTESERAGILQQARDSDRGVIANAFHELIVTDLQPELSNIRVPLTAIYVVPPNVPIPAAQYEGYMRMSYANAPQTRFVKVDDSYHFIMIDQQARFVDEVRRFLAE